MLINYAVKLCLLLLTLNAINVKAADFDNLIVFGDSLSDNGNVASITTYDFLNHPPYQQGFSNGQLAVERLATLLGLPLKPAFFFTGQILGTNFAFGSAKAGGYSFIDLSGQVDAFLQSQTGQAPAGNLYLVFIGGNDLRAMRDSADATTSNQLSEKALSGFDNNLRKLITAGAREILIISPPDISKLPETQALAENNPELLKTSAQLSKDFNRRLKQLVRRIERDTHIDLVLFDLPEFFNTILNNSTAFGFTDKNHGCYDYTLQMFNTGCTAGLINQHIFLDLIHPSAPVHKRLARALSAFIPAH